MNTFAIIVMVLFIMLLIISVSWFFDKSKKISGFRDASKQKTVVNKISTGDEYSAAYAIWIHVSDWSTYNGNKKVIFNAGDDGLIVSLGDTLPELIVNHGGTETKVSDIPLQTWVCIVISISSNALDIYINGKLVKTASPSSINHSTSEIVLSPSTTGVDGEDGVGFSGYTNGFKYYTSSLSPSEVWNIYRKGPGGTILGNLFGDRSVKLDILKGSDVTSSFKF